MSKHPHQSHPRAADAATAPVPGPGIAPAPPSPPSTVAWWKPTAEETAAFAADMGLRVEQLTPWTQAPNGDTVKADPDSFPALPALTEPVDVEVGKRYASFGYGSDGQPKLRTAQDFKDARKKCDDLFAAQSADAAEQTLSGSSVYEPDAIRLNLMTGLCSVAFTGSTRGAAGPAWVAGSLSAWLHQGKPTAHVTG